MAAVKGGTGKPSGPRKITARYLENAALAYLQRFATSTENFRRVMMRRVERSARVHDTDPAAGAALVEDLIERYLRVGLLDDRVFAEARVASLHAHGASRRAILARLREKGVAAAVIEAALLGLPGYEAGYDSGRADMAAAITYARRRRLGPWRPADQRDQRRERDLAALARAGFDYDLARRLIDAAGTDEAEALLGE